MIKKNKMMINTIKQINIKRGVELEVPFRFPNQESDGESRRAG